MINFKHLVKTYTRKEFQLNPFLKPKMLNSEKGTGSKVCQYNSHKTETRHKYFSNQGKKKMRLE